MRYIEKPMNVTLNIKPVFPMMIHSFEFQGPCRAGSENPVHNTSDGERTLGLKAYELFCQEIKTKIASDACLLEPVIIEYNEDWNVSEAKFEKLEDDLKKTDVFLIHKGQGLMQFIAVKLGLRYHKPVLMVCGDSGGEYSDDLSLCVPGDGTIPMACDAISHLRASGEEGWLSLDYVEFNRLVTILKIRKSFASTRVLRVFQGKHDNVNGNYTDASHLTRRYGMEFVDFTITHFRKEYDKAAADAGIRELAEAKTRQLMDDAAPCHMTYENLFPSVMFYMVIKKLLAEYRCNAFTLPCSEICPDGRLARDIRVTPCLAYSLLKDEGIAATCGADLPGLLAVMMALVLSRKSVFFGNIFLDNRENNTIYVSHDVPGFKMKGIDCDGCLPYSIKNFTLDGWGGTLRYDFALDRGETVTLLRFDPMGGRILSARGTLAGCRDVERYDCSLKALVTLRDVADYFHKCEDFGNHSTLVYGDYTQELRQIGRYMGFEVVEA